ATATAEPAATTTEAATAKATARAVARASFGPGARLVHRDGPAAERRAIELLDRLVGLLVTRHRDEREAARTSGHAVAHDGDRVDGADLAEQLLELGLAGLERKVA